MSLPSDPTTRPPFSGFTAPPRSSSAAAGWTKPSSSANAGLAPSSGFFPQPLPTQTQPILVPQSLNPTIINPPASVPTFALILPTLERSMQHPDLDLGAALPAAWSEANPIPETMSLPNGAAAAGAYPLSDGMLDFTTIMSLNRNVTLAHSTEGPVYVASPFAQPGQEHYILTVPSGAIGTIPSPTGTSFGSPVSFYSSHSPSVSPSSPFYDGSFEHRLVNFQDSFAHDHHNGSVSDATHDDHLHSINLGHGFDSSIPIDDPSLATFPYSSPDQKGYLIAQDYCSTPDLRFRPSQRSSSRREDYGPYPGLQGRTRSISPNQRLSPSQLSSRNTSPARSESSLRAATMISENMPSLDSLGVQDGLGASADQLFSAESMPPPIPIKMTDELLSTLSDSISSKATHKTVMYQCPFPGCDKLYTRPYNLKSHYRSHTGERPYGCEYCKSSFARKNDLKRHVKLHQGIKPHTCPICGKSFARRDALGRHVKSPENGGENNCEAQLKILADGGDERAKKILGIILDESILSVSPA